MSKNKTFFIVLESAEPTLINQWCEQGELPALDQLRKQGVWARLDSPSYLSSGCTWPTLSTGTSPAKHGIGFFHREIENGTYNIIKKYADHVKVEPFWYALGRAGLRCAIFDAPTSLPTPEVNGAIIVDWGSEHPAWKKSSYPRDLIGQLEKHVGEHPLNGFYQSKLTHKDDYKNVAEKLRNGVELRSRALRYLLSTNDYDFVLCNYAEPHWAGHLFWHLHDSSHPEHDAEAAAFCGDAIFDTYKACDTAVGKLVQDFPGANIIVASNIGMGSHAGGDMMAAEVLHKLGMSGDGNRSWKLLPGRKGQIAAVQNVEGLVGPKLIARLKKFVPERAWDKWTRKMLAIGNNWANSKAFLLPGDNSTLIRINLLGREPSGRIKPGEEYRALCAQLRDDFQELIDPASGQQAVEKVVIVPEHFQGDQIDQLPDLAVVWRDIGRPIEALESPKTGRIEIPEYNKRAGGHRHYGFMAAAGPLFRTGMELGNSNLADVAPTILSLFNVLAPDYMDGQVISDALLSQRTSAS